MDQHIDLAQGLESLSLETLRGYPEPSSVDPGAPPPENEVRYGLLSSLYHTLDPSIVASLEEAVLYGIIRDFNRALPIFEKFPTELKQHPIIVFERVQVLWAQWLLKDCAVVLDEALSWPEANAMSSTAPGIYTLLRIIQGKLYIFTKGDFRKARDAMLEVRAWLVGIPAEKYDHVQVKDRMLAKAGSMSS